MWNFCDNDSRKADLKAAYAAWATDRQISVLPSPRVCILDLKIIEDEGSASPLRINDRDDYKLPYDLNKGCGGSTPYFYIYFLPGPENDTINPIAEFATINTSDGESLENLPEGFEEINHDLNRGIAGSDYIYLAFRRRNSYTDKLITSLKVNSVYTFGASDSFTWYTMNQNYTSAHPQDLNEGAGGNDISLL
jgi:hypothetical protein